MKIALMMVTDGRERCFAKTLSSLDAIIGLGSFDYRVVIDDGCSPAYTDFLDRIGRWDLHVWPQAEKRGFGGAIAAGWAAVKLLPEVDYVFHLEDDFTFNRHFSLRNMEHILATYSKVVQVALKRQPWGSEGPGGFVGDHPDHFTQHLDEDTGQRWFDHQLFFTTNPSMYRRSLLDVGWPGGDRSEEIFTRRLLDADPLTRFAYLGEKLDEPWVHHIGDARVGAGY